MQVQKLIQVLIQALIKVQIHVVMLEVEVVMGVEVQAGSIGFVLSTIAVRHIKDEVKHQLKAFD